MNYRLRIAFAVLGICLACALNAQKIGFSLPWVNDAAPGSNKSLAVRVTNFDSIVSMQFVIRWNPDVLKYLTIDNFGALPNLDLTRFNVTHALDSGYVRMVWEGPNSYPGVSIPDGTTIFRFRFNVVGADTSSSQIKFTEITYSFPQTEFEIVQVVHPGDTLRPLHEDECMLTHGFVAVGYTVATHESEQDELEMYISPNPFTDVAKASFTLIQSGDIEAIVTDVTGRIIYTREMPGLSSGIHSLELNHQIFPSKGAYFLTIRSGSQTCVRPLFFH